MAVGLIPVHALDEKFAQECPPTQTLTQKFKSIFSSFSSQEVDSSLVSLVMLFYALQSESFGVSFAGFKNPENPGIVSMAHRRWSFLDVVSPTHNS